MRGNQLVQLLLLWPASPHLPHRRGRLLGGGERGLLEAGLCRGGDGAGLLMGVLGRGTVGRGQVMSRYCSSQ